MFITRELFVIPNENNFVLFAPLKGILLEVNESVVALLAECEKTGFFPEGPVLDQLRNSGILFDEPEPPMKPRPIRKRIEPDGVTLFPTSDCGLCCTYCYASAGESNLYLSPHIAHAAIDLVFANAIKHKQKRVAVGFHGGGEPFYGRSWAIVKDAVIYARELSAKHGIYLSLSSATNGVLSLKQLEWIVQNFGNLNISLDGPEDIQNRQRPLRSGGESFPFVMRTIKFLEERKFSYGLRATITKESCGRLIELIDFFRSISTLTRLHFEPLFECGRCRTTGAEAPEPEAFVRAMVEAIPYAKKQGIDLYYSGASIDKVVDSFCGATGRSFCVTPQGNVTSCFEVSLESDPRSERFFYGKYDEQSGQFVFNEDRIAFLRTRTVQNLPGCADCFIKYQCAGDCLAKMDALGDMFTTGDNVRCFTNHALSKFKITERLLQQRQAT